MGACVSGVSAFNDPGVGVFLWRDGQAEEYSWVF